MSMIEQYRKFKRLVEYSPRSRHGIRVEDFYSIDIAEDVLIFQGTFTKKIADKYIGRGYVGKVNENKATILSANGVTIILTVGKQ